MFAPLGGRRVVQVRESRRILEVIFLFRGDFTVIAPGRPCRRSGYFHRGAGRTLTRRFLSKKNELHSRSNLSRCHFDTRNVDFFFLFQAINMANLLQASVIHTCRLLMI